MRSLVLSVAVVFLAVIFTPQLNQFGSGIQLAVPVASAAGNKQFSEHGFSFTYPDEYQVVSESKDGFVEVKASKIGGMVLIQIFGFRMDTSLRNIYIKAFQDSMSGEGGAIISSKEGIEKVTLFDQGLGKSVSIESRKHTSRIRIGEGAESVYMVLDMLFVSYLDKEYMLSFTTVESPGIETESDFRLIKNTLTVVR